MYTVDKGAENSILYSSWYQQTLLLEKNGERKRERSWTDGQSIAVTHTFTSARGNPHKHGENMQTAHRKAGARTSNLFAVRKQCFPQIHRNALHSLWLKTTLSSYTDSLRTHVNTASVRLWDICQVKNLSNCTPFLNKQRNLMRQEFCSTKLMHQS